MRYATIIFDLDGTLLDSQEGIFAGFRHALDILGVPLDPAFDMYQLIGPLLADSFKKYFHQEGERNDLAVHTYREYYERKGMYQVRLYDSVMETLHALVERGHRLELVTFKTLIFTNRILEHQGIRQYFAATYGPAVGVPHFDKVERFQAIAQGLPSDQILVVGDRGADIRAARSAGLRSCAVTYGYGGREELETEKPDYLIQSIQELLRIV
jgi:phosphoglycolate phosphatase